MKITSNKLFSGILLFGLITIPLVLLDVQYFYTRTIFSFILLTIVPGFLIMLMLKVRKIGFWEYLIYTIGLSIAFLMFGGLTVNWILPWLHISDEPLSLIPLLTGFCIFLSIFGVIAYRRNKKISLEIKFPKLSCLNILFFTLPIAFPILSILGAVNLNNGISNYLTMIMLGGIALYILLLVLLKNKLNGNIYPWSIFNISLSILLMTSLRGWYLSGHDIKLEYYIFKLTNFSHIWNYGSFPNPYNSCLAINILPTVLNSFLKINDMYIYKIAYQIIFAVCPVIIYILSKKFVEKSVALLSSIFFVSFPIFINDLSFHNRQEIAFLFIALLLLSLFNIENNNRKKSILFIIFGAGMIISHYTTTYLSLILLSGSYIINLIINKIKKTTQDTQSSIKFFPLSFLLVFTLVWTTQVTYSLNNVYSFINKINIEKIFTNNFKSDDINYTLFLSENKQSDVDKLKSYMLLREKLADINNSELNNNNIYYSKDTFTKYPVTISDPPVIDATGIGKFLEKHNISAFDINYYLRQITAKLVQILVLIGLIAIIFIKKFKNNINADYTILSIMSVVIIIFTLIIPFITIDYSLLRTFQHFLIILSLPAIIGCLLVFNILGKRLALYFTSVIILTIFLILSGFIPQIIGNYYPQLNLNNKGYYYNAYYTYASEIKSIKWLKINNTNNSIIESDSFGVSKLLAYGNLIAFNQIIPSTIRKDSYVYLPFYLTKTKILTLFYQGNQLFLNYPTEFLDINKNLIYSNRNSKIYK